MIIMHVALWIPLALVCILTGYLVLLTLAAYLYRKPGVPDAPPLKIAVVIPAHDEESQIAATVHTVAASDYPAGHREIFVIADNCTDQTAIRAREADAAVFERNDLDNRGKGQAVNWWITGNREMLDRFDAVAMIDADTHMNRAFLREISASLSAPGVVAVQGCHAVANPETNWRTALVFAGYALINHTRPMGRTRLGGTCGLNGNGMAFRTEILKERGWKAFSVVEDVEYGVRLLLDGVRAHYIADAKVVTGMPASSAQAAPQRRRWEGGRMQLCGMLLPSLLWAAVRSFRWRYLDAALDLLTPPLSVLVMLQALLLVAALLLHPALALVALACVAGLVFHVFSGLYLSKAPRRVWVCLAAAPFFVAWKIPIYATMLVRGGERTWRRTARDKEDSGGEPR